jgi:outer membrane lipoprotein-sorting protein
VQRIKCSKQRENAVVILTAVVAMMCVTLWGGTVLFFNSTALAAAPPISSRLDYQDQGTRITTAKETIKTVRASLNRIKPFKVNFTQQVYTDEQLDIEESGEIIFKDDQLLKWTYLDPDYKVFLLEGDNYQFYDEDNQQLMIGKIKDRSQQWVWQMLFSDDIFRDYLVNWDKIRKRIRIKNNSGSRTGDTADIAIDIEIIIDTDFLPVTLIQADPSGARIVYQFRDYKPQIEIPGDTFRLKVPDDVEIIRE